ncbi:MAG: hypothetical protein NC218_09060 [Acetobacter sp.]|nr:hypothetical protein [Acetobacter sp.]
MLQLYKQNDKTQVYVNQYVADTEEDMKQIPLDTLYPGSTCIVTSTVDVYMLSASKEWIKL